MTFDLVATASALLLCYGLTTGVRMLGSYAFNLTLPVPPYQRLEQVELVLASIEHLLTISAATERLVVAFFMFFCLGFLSLSF